MTSPSGKRSTLLPRLTLALLAPALSLLLLPRPAAAQQPKDQPMSAQPTLTARQIVQNMVDRNQQRAEALRGYTELRHYTVAYHGFPSLRAAMTVEATYTAPSTKTFHIVSKSGPSLLIDHVLKRLLTSEAEAARDPAASSITPENYNFTLDGQGAADGNPCYILQADPKQDSKFLFRGKIWVDAHDFAIVQIEAQPAKDPSFWIRKTEIHHVYAKTGEFWLPEENQSRTDVRFGGTADLTIDYGTPHIEKAPVEAAASTPPSSQDKSGKSDNSASSSRQ